MRYAIVGDRMVAWIRAAWPTKSRSNVQAMIPACTPALCKRTKCLRLRVNTDVGSDQKF